MSELTRVLEQVTKVLAAHRIVDAAFTGGIAVGVWAEPRQTRDLDLCGVLALEEVNRLLSLRDGRRVGAGELPDMVRFRVGDWDVHLFLCKDAYDRACLDRAIDIDFDGTKIRVVRAEDLLVHKLIKLRTDRRRLLQDVADLRAVIVHQRETLDWTYLRTWLPSHEAQLLAEVAAASDEDIVRRLLGA